MGPAEEDDFAANIIAGLEDLGIPAVALGEPIPPLPGRRTNAIAYTLRRDPRLGPLIEQGLVRRAEEQEVDVVITVVSLTPTTVRALCSAGARVAMWFPDHVANLGSLWMFDAPYDALFFKEPVLVRRLTSLLTLPVYYLPEACNPRIHRPVESTEASGKVAVIGNLHPIRARLLDRLADDGIPLAIYGSPFHAELHSSLQPFHAGRYVRGLDKSAVFSSAAAVLNNFHPAEIEGVNCRVFEATAAEGALVSEHRAELKAFFDVGDEILEFRSYEELLDALRRLVDDAGLGKKLGKAASIRCRAEYTYSKRLSSLLDIVAT